MNKQNDYKDIIGLPHHQSTKHKHMSLYDRAAQFAPFAALKGYDAAIEETARFTDRKVELSEEELFVLNDTTRILLDTIDQQPFVKITYFVPDEKKDGGSYRVKEGNLRRIDEVQRLFCFTDRTEISIDDIRSIETQ